MKEILFRSFQMLIISGSALLAFAADGESMTVPSGQTAELTTSKTLDELIVNGTLVIKGDGVTVSAKVIHVAEAGSEGVLELTDSAVLTCSSARGWDGNNNHYPFSIGCGGGKGILNVSNGAKLMANDIIVADQNHNGAGSNPSYGILDVCKATVTVSGNLWQARGDNISGEAVWHPYYSDIQIHTDAVVSVTGLWTHNATSEARVLFDGGQFKYAKMRCQGGKTLCLEGLNGNAIDVETTSSDPLFYFNAETASFSFSDDGGGLFIRGCHGSGNTLFGGTSAALQNVMSVLTGPIVLNDGVTLSLSADVTAFARNDLVMRGTNSRFYLSGKNAAFASIDEQARGLINGASSSSMLFLGAGTEEDQTIAGLCPNIGVTWRGAGTLTLGADRLQGLVVESGSVVLQGSSQTGYRMYGFKVDACYGASASCMQFSELVLKDANSQDLREFIVANSSARLFDGDFSTKCYYETSKGFDGMLTTVTFSEARPVVKYTWVTANDYGPKSHDRNGVYDARWPSLCRDPATWRLLGSNDGGMSWTEISRVEGYEAPDAPNVLIGEEFTCTYPSRFVDGGAFVVAAGASLAIKGDGEIVCDTMDVSGVVDATGVVTVRLNVGSDEDETVFFKPGSLDSALAKSGSGRTLAYVGDAPVGESVTVSAGTLRLARDATVTEKYWRIRIKQLQGTNASPAPQTAAALQFAELGLYASDGTRVAYSDTAPSAFAYSGPGVSLGVAKAFDGLMDSSHVIYKDISASTPQPNPSVDTTWLVLSFKIPDEVPPIAAYLFSSGHDTHNERHPYSWDVLVSATGEDGTWRVLDERNAESSTNVKQSFGSYNGGVPWTFVGKAYGPDATMYATDAVVKIGAGARLQLSSPTTVTGALEIDASQGDAGSLSHFNAAPSGVLNVVGLSKFSGTTFELPIIFENVSNAESVSSWKLKLEGVESGRYAIALKEGRLLLCKRGMILTVR